METIKTNKSLSNYELINSLLQETKNRHQINSNVYDTYFKKYEHKVIKTYDSNKEFITPISFCEYNYKIVCYSIIKSMYNSQKSWNYKGVKDIVENGYNDNLIEDLEQLVLMVMYENTKRLLNKSINYRISFKELFKVHKNCVVYDSHKNLFVLNKEYPCNTIWLACYRTVSNFLYNQNTKVSTKQTYIDYDENSQQMLIMDKKQYQEYLYKDSYNDLFMDDSYKSFITIVRVVKTYIEMNEKSFISEKCQSVLNLLIKGYKHKDIATTLNISINSVTKYHNIIKDAYYTLYKKPSPKKDSNYNSDYSYENHQGHIKIEFNRSKKAYKDYEIHSYNERLYNDLFGIEYNQYLSINTDNANPRHKALQKMYESLFG